MKSKRVKAVISLILAFNLIFSLCPFAGAMPTGGISCSGETVTVHSPFYYAEEFFGRIINSFAVLFNNLFGEDENVIEKPAENEKAWQSVDSDFVIENPEKTLEAQTWIMNELTYVSEKSYTDPYNDIDIDLILVGNGRQYTVPGFWDGGNTWKIRFVCPSVGTWYFRTVCTDITNASLNNRTGRVICTQYTGQHDIYKNGFVTTDYGKKYLTYDDGTPFFYLGDTHWSLGDETPEIVRAICDKRVEQGFTVYQSEPIGAKFYLENSVTDYNLPGFVGMDEKFAIIAEHGFVHANAQFFFTAEMRWLIEKFGGCTSEFVGMSEGENPVELYEFSDGVKNCLEKLTRYWVARYSAYPVLWTLGQEADNDFYFERGEHMQWAVANNPYKLVAEYLDKYDCYDHPITAHQENTGATSAYGSGENAPDKRKVYNKNASPSCFRDVKAHTWYAAQWNPAKTEQFDYNVTKDYWFNSQGKPVVNYEGAYCGFWTMNFGARMQGWCSYLSGMYGYGWGGQDTWSYLSVFDEENSTTDGLDTITFQQKQDATWETSLEYPSTYQCGYMADFFSNVEWYNLIPRFDNKAYFVPGYKVFSAYASNSDNSDIVIYFYSFSDKTVAEKTNANKISGTSTGTIGMLEKSQTYKYRWFNPITGEYTEEGTFVSSCSGTHFIGKKAPTDMVLHVTKLS